MSSLDTFSDIELLDLIAAYNGNPVNVAALKHEIFRRISTKTTLSCHDVALVDLMLENLQRIEKDDFDLPHQSQRMRNFGKRYAISKERLLARMNGENLVLQEERMVMA